MKEGYIKQEDRKNILLLTDDIRVHSGVAQIGREMVMNTAHRYNWVQLAGAIKHPDKGNIQDLSEATNKHIGIKDSKVILYPCDGYGEPKLLREVIKRENIDAVFLFGTIYQHLCIMLIFTTHVMLYLVYLSKLKT